MDWLLLSRVGDGAAKTGLRHQRRRLGWKQIHLRVCGDKGHAKPRAEVTLANLNDEGVLVDIGKEKLWRRHRRSLEEVAFDAICETVSINTCFSYNPSTDLRLNCVGSVFDS